MERRLAAIFAADVAGYSRLVGADEEGTVARLRSHRRELIEPKIAEHHGRLVKTTGDALRHRAQLLLRLQGPRGCARELLGGATRETVAQARAMYRRAIELDPTYAVPHAGLA